MNGTSLPLSKSVPTVGWSAVITIVFVMVITVVAELVPPVKDWLKSVFTHHWIGKGVLAALLFLMSLIILRATAKQAGDRQVQRVLVAAVWSSLLGTVVLLGFFLYEAFGRS